MMKLSLLAAVVSLALAGAVRAEDTADESKKAAVLEEARQHVAKAKVHYDLGEFKEAADEYTLVYRLRPIPALLFNIAQAYRQAGEYDKAKQFYKSYLRESPEAKNRTVIEQAIREMDELLAKEKRTKEKPPNGVKEPADTSLPIQSAARGQPEKKPVEQKPAAVAQKPPEQKPGEHTSFEVAKAPEQKPVQPVATQPAVTQPAPRPPAVAMATPRQPAPSAAITSTRAPVMEEDEPLYKKWWLWTAVGVVAVGAGVAAMTMGGNSPPNSHYGTTPVFP